MKGKYSTGKVLAVVGLMTTLASGVLADDANGKKTYDRVCSTCHGKGIGGAPKFGDQNAWKERIGQDESVLFDHALKGFKGKKGIMPAKGGRKELADDDVRAAVKYMVGAVQ